ncbi:MAG TPA: metal-dependent transcriptional regulator [Candidatus Sulfotelmatobacter sp.]|nr:metal-dependent transcriptional regulator [Candidatus Sulfotelmatobacter sp.]
MHRKKPLSETHEMYLKTVLKVRGPHEVARVRDVAEGLGLTPGTVSLVVKKLDHMHLLEHDRYGFVALTPRGEQVAACVLRRFETIRGLLVEVLGVDPKTADDDACAMEHAVSPATVNRMRVLLERFRSGRLALPAAPRSRRSRSADPCARCEALGSCQADAAGSAT